MTPEERAERILELVPQTVCAGNHTFRLMVAEIKAARAEAIEESARLCEDMGQRASPQATAAAIRALGKKE